MTPSRCEDVELEAGTPPVTVSVSGAWPKLPPIFTPAYQPAQEKTGAGGGGAFKAMSAANAGIAKRTATAPKTNFFMTYPQEPAAVLQSDSGSVELIYADPNRTGANC